MIQADFRTSSLAPIGMTAQGADPSGGLHASSTIGHSDDG